MKRTTDCKRLAVGLAIALALAPGTAGTAFAATGTHQAADQAVATADTLEKVRESANASKPSLLLASMQEAAVGLREQMEQAEAAAQAELTDKVLAYDRADIDAIGTQESTGHTICCPSFSCAYADAVMDGTVHDHDYYTCSNCTWTDWGGGNSSYRCVGTDEELLREAYDQIAAGRPTVIHVAASYGEHWIALIGYQNATDPDHLELSNFIALDPWDGSEVNAGDSFTLYGDGCEHISEKE